MSKNFEVHVDKDGIAHITFDTKKRFGPSTSGKTIIVSTTEGNQPIKGLEYMKIGLNVYVKA